MESNYSHKRESKLEGATARRQTFFRAVSPTNCAPPEVVTPTNFLREIETEPDNDFLDKQLNPSGEHPTTFNKSSLIHS